jgi:serine/threonine protein kinase
MTSSAADKLENEELEKSHYENRAEKLVGLALNQRWVVLEQISIKADGYGGTRAVCYRAVNTEGAVAFVKAFDFRFDDDSGDTRKLERNVSEFNHEKDLHERCKQLQRVTRIYDHGKIAVDGYNVHFIICEYAEQSFRNHHPPGDGDVPASERLDALKKITLAILELHSSKVAHQDLKPSNAVRFDDDRIKVTDLGSATCEDLSAPHDSDVLVGQPTYAPYELLYRSEASMWNKPRRRYGCDAFLLGNLIFTVFTGASLSMLLLHAIPEEMQPINFDGHYDEVLPHLTAAHYLCAELALREFVPSVIADDLCRLVVSLCHPDPSQRGLGRGFDRGDRHLDLRRCVGTLNSLAAKAKLYEQQQKRLLASKTT